MTSTLGYTNKLYSHSIQSESTDMTEDEDFLHFNKSSSFQTNTTNSSPINGKLDSDDVLLNQVFYNKGLKRPMDLYSNTNNIHSISTIYESSPILDSSSTLETPTTHLGMTTSPSMRALENILNQKTKSNLNISTIQEQDEVQLIDLDDFQPPTIYNIQNQSELSINSYHTAQSVNSDDFMVKKSLLNNENNDDFYYDDDRIVNSPNFSPMFNNPVIDSPVKGLGLLSMSKSMNKPMHNNGSYKSMLDIGDTNPVEVKPTKQLEVHLIKPLEIHPIEVQPMEVKSRSQIPNTPEIDKADDKKNRRKSFAGFFKNKKTESTKPKKDTNHVKSKSYSNFEFITKEDTKPKSKFFSAFKRKSAFAVNDVSNIPKQNATTIAEPVAEPVQRPIAEPVVAAAEPTGHVIKEKELRKGHSKRNSLLVPSPNIDNNQFDQIPQPQLLKDLSFSTSMISSINHNYDIMAHSDIDEQDEFSKEVIDLDEDEFNSSFNSIKQSYSNEDEKFLQPPSMLIPRDTSVGSFKMNFDEFNIDNYSIDDQNVQQSMIPTLSNKTPAQKLQHHKTSSKIQNLLGEALFPKSLDINEVTSITTLERTMSMKSIRSNNNSSLRNSLMVDGMTIIRSPTSPKYEPNSTILSSPSSILKRRSMDYDDDLEEFAKMINFGDDDDDELDEFDFTVNLDNDLILDTPIEPVKPLPSVPSEEEWEYDDEIPDESHDEIQEDDLYEDHHQYNPFSYDSNEPLEFEIKAEHAEFDFEAAYDETKSGLEESETEEDETFDKNVKYDDDDLSVKIKQGEEFGEDFNDYNFTSPPQPEKSPNVNVFIPEQQQSQRPISMSAKGGLNGPKFGETNKLVQSNKNTHSMYMPHDSFFLSQGLQISPSRLNLNSKIGKKNDQIVKKVTFSSRIILFDTYHEDDYDRHPEIATCNQLTPFLAQRIKEELNQVKSEMEVHESSRCYTQFF